MSPRVQPHLRPHFSGPSATPSLTRATRKLLDTGVAIQMQPPSKQDFMFCHSILAQLCLPRVRIDGREFHQRSGAAWISLQAGMLDEGGGPVWQPVPHGVMARLLLMWICTYAVRYRKHDIDVEDRAAGLLKRLQYDLQGWRYSTLRQQLHAWAACRLQLGFQGHTVNSQPIHQFDAWLPRASGADGRWPKVLQLSQEFYAEIVEHGVPLDRRAVTALKGSTLALDIYVWLAYRLHQVGRQSVHVSWLALMRQFAHSPTGRHAVQTFQRCFLHALRQALVVYPGARVTLSEGGINLLHSQPPIPRSALNALKKEAGTQGGPHG
ncbi:replication protein RepA [Comamonas thiooxydans]|uniref:replication protein RepA n=1 Tax=Comamonas thiooxydans TaxID=363952 RepID=UPI002449409A|nr:replication protein RepA [Comamonas thiooxydans]MDH1251785.1 replication protein RepA [Comamonas thiooxydans]